MWAKAASSMAWASPVRGPPGSISSGALARWRAELRRHRHHDVLVDHDHRERVPSGRQCEVGDGGPRKAEPPSWAGRDVCMD
jgi:hypothetical protein